MKYKWGIPVVVILIMSLFVISCDMNSLYTTGEEIESVTTFGTKERRSFIRNALKGYTATEDNGIKISEPIIFSNSLIDNDEYSSNASATVTDKASYLVISEGGKFLCYCTVAYNTERENFVFGYTDGINEYLWDALINGKPFALYSCNSQYSVIITEEGIYQISGGEPTYLSQFDIPKCELKVIEFVPLNP